MANYSDLEDLSFEAQDLTPVKREDLINPVFGREFDNLTLLVDTYLSVESRGYVCRDDVQKISPLKDQYDPLKKLFDRYPVNSFSLEYSRINYEVSNEGFLQTAYNAVVDTLKRVLAYIADQLKAVWKYMTENQVKTEKVDRVAPTMQEIQDYLINVDMILARSAVADSYKKESNRIKRTELGNLKHKWNGFLDNFRDDPDTMRGYLDILGLAFQTKLNPFVDFLTAFLDTVKSATTEREILAAIKAMDQLDMNSGELIKMATSLGFNPSKVNVNKRMTNFQSIAVHIQNVFKGWKNDRSSAVSDDDFLKMVLDLKIDSWADTLDEITKSENGRIAKTQDIIRAFSASDLKPGLEKVYSLHLAPFMVSLSSIVTGFATLETCIGILADTRNNYVAVVSTAGLNMVKGTDQFWKRNQRMIGIADNATVLKYRRAVQSAMRD